MRVSNPSIGADSHWSSAFPCGTPSITSTRTTVRASSFSASRWAAVAPTLPAPTTVILVSTGTFRSVRGGPSPAPRMHLPVRVGAQRVDPVERAAVGKREALLGAAVGAALPRLPDERRQLRVPRAPAQRVAQIDPALRVEAQEPGAVGGDAAAVARAAERRRGRGDDPERRPVGQPEALGRRVRIARDRIDPAV